MNKKPPTESNISRRFRLGVHWSLQNVRSYRRQTVETRDPTNPRSGERSYFQIKRNYSVMGGWGQIVENSANN